jgi:hypothetical protein
MRSLLIRDQMIGEVSAEISSHLTVVRVRSRLPNSKFANTMSGYSVIRKPQRFFKVGRVFMTLWSEPASPNLRDSPNVSSSLIGGRIFSETRHFVVIQKRQGSSLCCPIHTYRKQGTTKLRVGAEYHAIVYAAGSKPELLPQEQSPGMGSFPIVVEDKFVTIDKTSRLNFGKIYTVEHNIKVRNVGKVEKEAVPRLMAALLKSIGIDALDPEMESEKEEGEPTQPFCETFGQT